MKLTVLLCDFAQVADGKLHLSGAGWNIAGPGPVPCGLGILVEVPWHRANTPIKLSIELREQDGPVVTQNGLAGEQPVRLEAQLEVGRPAGMIKGSPLNVPLAINVPPLQLGPNRRYSWEVHVEGEPDRDEWHVSFQTRSFPPPGMSLPPDSRD